MFSFGIHRVAKVHFPSFPRCSDVLTEVDARLMHSCFNYETMKRLDRMLPTHCRCSINCFSIGFWSPYRDTIDARGYHSIHHLPSSPPPPPPTSRCTLLPGCLLKGILEEFARFLLFVGVALYPCWIESVLSVGWLNGVPAEIVLWYQVSCRDLWLFWANSY